MKHLLLFLGTLLLCIPGRAQYLLWESTDQIRPRQFDLQQITAGDASSDEFSILDLHNYDHDGQPDLVTIENNQSGGVITVIPSSAKELHFDMHFASPEGPYKFLGFLSTPAVSCSSTTTNQLLLGKQSGNRIIAILVGFCPTTEQGESSIQTRQLDIGDNYAFMGAYDLDNNGQAEFLLFNADLQKVQLWSF